MVALEEIEDETFQTGQIGPEFDDEDYTDTGTSLTSTHLHTHTILYPISNLHSTDSEISEDDLPQDLDETLTERIYALRDIIPATTRSSLSHFFRTTTSYIKSGFGFGGKALFVLTTSALLLGVPWALAFAEEQQMVEMEKEMRMREMGGELVGSGAGEGKPAL